MQDLVIRETYEKDGVEQVSWNKVGVLITSSNGKQYVKLNHIPNTMIYVFDQKQKEKESF